MNFSYMRKITHIIYWQDNIVGYQLDDGQQISDGMLGICISEGSIEIENAEYVNKSVSGPHVRLLSSVDNSIHCVNEKEVQDLMFQRLV